MLLWSTGPLPEVLKESSELLPITPYLVTASNCANGHFTTPTPQQMWPWFSCGCFKFTTNTSRTAAQCAVSGTCSCDTLQYVRVHCQVCQLSKAHSTLNMQFCWSTKHCRKPGPDTMPHGWRPREGMWMRTVEPDLTISVSVSNPWLVGTVTDLMGPWSDK